LPQWSFLVLQAGGKPMDDEMKSAWRRGAIALAVPASCLLVLALLCVRGAALREFWNVRAIGVVTNLNRTNKGGCHPTIEYSVGGKTYNFQPAWTYSAKSFALGQNVTVLYPPSQPGFGMLDAFGEVWLLPLGLSVVCLVLLVLGWKARTGLPPILHGLAGFGLFVMGAVVGMSVFGLLCMEGGLELFVGAPVIVSMLGGIVLFFALVPSCALLAGVSWHHYVPARCSRCSGRMPSQFIGKQLIYTCDTCGNRR
jgi:hypothetical protein